MGYLLIEVGKMSNEFGIFIKEKRNKRSLNVRTLAKLTGKSISYISSIETGQRSAPSDEVLEKLAEVLCLNSRDKARMFDLAAKTKSKPTVAADLVTYINENELVHDVLRFSKEREVEASDWQSFMNMIKNKY